jgi:hypothetical protein
MKILGIRQEGTPSTGGLLFVDLETKGRFGKIEASFQLDMQTGDQLGLGFVDGKSLRRKATVDELVLLHEAFTYFQANGPTGAAGYPNVA